MIAPSSRFALATQGMCTSLCLLLASCVFEPMGSDGVIDSDDPNAEPIPGDSPPDRVAEFRQGGDYDGTRDTYVSQDARQSSFGHAQDLMWDQRSGNQGPGEFDFDSPDFEDRATASEIAFLRFDDIFGTDPGQVPPQATIVSATLTTHILEAGGKKPGSIFMAMTDWTESITWNDVVQYFGYENIIAGARVADAPYGVGESCPCADYQIDVTSSVRDWAAGTPNYGWTFIAGDDERVRIASSESDSLRQRPMLRIQYTE